MDQLAPEDLVDEWSDLSASSLGSGAQLGRYELLLPIAQGGMARVWAARQRGQRGFQKIVAIKTILPHLAHNPEFERMFLDEARIAAGVHHPNVTEIYELGEEGKVLYLAMEWVNGDSLMNVLKGGTKVASPIDARLAARIVADACAGLHAAHELTDDDGKLLKVVHRDVSPHNLLVSIEGNVKVTDFGVAKAYGQSQQETAAGQVKGKVAYMAPEYIGGLPFDRRADVFAAGCLLYETVTGLRPFRGESDPQVMQAVLRGTYDPPASVVKGIAPELTGVIDRALAGDPAKRFASAEAMRVALEEYLARSGPVVTSTQVGALVRQRLGPAIDKRREHVKAALATLQSHESSAGTPRVLPAAGHTPSKPQPVSRSGVQTAALQGPPPPPPMRPRTASLSGQTGSAVGAPAPVAAVAPVATAGTPASAAAVPAASPAPSSGKYLLAAVAGIAFALVFGVLALLVWLKMQPAASVAPPAPATAAKPPAVPPSPPPSAEASSAPSAATAVHAASAVPAAPGPSTFNIDELPTARPTTVWTPPAAPVVKAPAAPASTHAPALPANPY